MVTQPENFDFIAFIIDDIALAFGTFLLLLFMIIILLITKTEFLSWIKKR